jgi:predicted MPP superfamily phosphohydrolase
MERKSASRLLTTLLLVASALWSVTAQDFALPSAPTSVKFAAIGDTGSGDPGQYDVANQMTRFRAKFPFDLVIMLGDNIYGGQGAQDLVKKFSQPYKALLDAGVKFYASLGNHDDPVNRQYLWFANIPTAVRITAQTNTSRPNDTFGLPTALTIR